MCNLEFEKRIEPKDPKEWGLQTDFKQTAATIATNGSQHEIWG